MLAANRLAVLQEAVSIIEDFSVMLYKEKGNSSMNKRMDIGQIRNLMLTIIEEERNELQILPR